MKSYRITCTIQAEDTTVADVREYAQQALKAFGGQRDPEDPFFGSNKTVGAVKVSTVRKRRPRKAKEVL